MKTLNITDVALDAAIKAREARGGNVHCSDCLVAQAALNPSTEGLKVVDSGSFYIDTNQGTITFAGGYDGETAKKVRTLIDLFRAKQYPKLRAMLPFSIPVS